MTVFVCLSVCQCQSQMFNDARTGDHYEVHEGAVESQNYVGKRLMKRNVLRRGRDGDDWMSDGSVCV